jgi:hypothetical protein
VRQKGSTPSAKNTTKIQAKKSSQKHECKLPLNKCISPTFSSLDAKTPPYNHELGTFLPLLVMHESCLQMQACASQIYKEHYNMLKIDPTQFFSMDEYFEEDYKNEGAKD